MITLYTFGPYFGLPDGSPFVTKAMMLLKLAGQSYEENRGGYGKAPKGKLPYIDDAGTIVADSTFIQTHLEKKYGFDFDAGLSAPQRAAGWAFAKMCEDHLNWAVIQARWLDDANFVKGPAHFFDAVPAPIRGLVKAMVRRKQRKALHAHGLGRHSEAEIAALAIRDINAISCYLGEHPYFMGDAPAGADATIFAFVAGLLCPVFDTPLRDAAEARPNLVAYNQRMMRRYFPDLAKG